MSINRAAVRVRLVLIASVMLVTGLSCGGSPTNSSAAPAGSVAPTTVRVGLTPSLLYLAYYVAQEKGYFGQRGITMATTTVTNPANGLVSGDLDIGLGGLDIAMVTAAQGRPTPVVVVYQQHNSLTLVARSDLNLPHLKSAYPAAVKDLPKGATIAAISRSGSSWVFLHSVLDGAGLKEGTDFTIVVIGTVADQLAALKAKRIEAGVLFPPFDAQAVSLGVAQQVVAQAKGQGPPGIVASYGGSIMANPEYLKAHGDAIKAIVAAMVEAERFVHDFTKNKEELVRIAVKYTGVTDVSLIEQSLPSVADNSIPTADCKRVDAESQLLLSVGSIPSAPPCNKIVALDYVPKNP